MHNIFYSILKIGPLFEKSVVIKNAKIYKM